MVTEYGLGAWLKQELAFGDGDTEEFALFREQLVEY
jgi:Zn-dependent metalloprotease